MTPGTLEPFSGRVVRSFAGGSGKVQIEGTLEKGTWEGELKVYHPSGRIRYQGRLWAGSPCGAWVENRDDEEAGSLYLMLKQHIESMGIYPECPERKGLMAALDDELVDVVNSRAAVTALYQTALDRFAEDASGR